MFPLWSIAYSIEATSPALTLFMIGFAEDVVLWAQMASVEAESEDIIVPE